MRSAGDKARDAGLWAKAAYNYKLYLGFDRKNVPIWVQFGNCSKEAGDYKTAATAYATALRLDPDNADAHLQRGHLLKITGQTDQAMQEFKASLDLQPDHNPAFNELLALGAVNVVQGSLRDTAPPRDSTIIYIDVTDILDYLRVNMSLSGIQRVVANLIEFAEAFEKRNPGCMIRPVFPDYGDTNVYAVRMSLLKGLIDAVAVRSSREVVDRALDAVRDSRTRVTLTARDTLLIPGAFWIYQRYDLLNRLRQDGVRVTVFIHDLIQITNPEFVEPAATTVFRRSFVDVLGVASYLLTNSRFVAADTRAYMQQRMNFTVPVLPVTLATELGKTEFREEAVSSEIRELLTQDYVLYVSTIEIRKNHLYLIKIWEKLIEDGADWIPNLVFVGKWGWEIDELRKHLQSSDYLGGRLYIFNGISDIELAQLYEHCKLTVYPSYAEGWGLPVGESLGYGKPCIASKVTSIPEVGGDFCRYLDPFDWEDGYRVIAKTLADRPALEAWTQTVKTKFVPKTWKTFTHELFDAILRFAYDKTLDPPGNNCIIESGAILTFGNDALAQLDAKRRSLVTGRMARTTGWHGLEAWGCWASRRHAELHFRTRMEPGAELLVFLLLATPAGDLSAECTVKSGPHATFVDDLGPTPRWCTARGQVSEDGDLRIVLVSGRGYQHLHGRELYIGVVAVAVSPLHDRKMRELVISRIVPGGLEDEPEVLPAPRADKQPQVASASASVVTAGRVTGGADASAVR